MQRLRPREIQLFVSYDQGSRWQHAQSADPSSGRFDFEATQDGEYWFAVKTLDNQNRLFPRDNVDPGLKVVVDATRPVLNIQLREIGKGKVQLRWSADDRHLDPTTLRLEFAQSGSPGWQQVSVVPQASGHTEWTVPQGGSVAVRGTVSDLAGNVGQAENRINVPASDNSDPASEETEYREPVARGNRQPEPFAPSPGGARSAFGKDSRRTPTTSFDESRPAVGPRRPDSPAVSGTNLNAASQGTLVSDAPKSRPEVIQRRDPQSTKPAENQTTRPVLKHVVNRRNFHIGYRIDGAGPSSVGSVELYVTQDRGGQWSRYGEDPDRQSPFPVTVPADGEYGFELRVRNAVGLSTEPPRPGDTPSIIVTVDQTPPVAHLLPLQAERGASPAGVLIQWEVRDDHLGTAPVALAYAPSLNGPWRQIGDWQPNSGRTVWSPEPGSSARMYLRLTARDEAGNVAEITSQEAVIVDRSRPTVRILREEALDRRANPY
jgi:hypothetical protein